MCSCSISDNLNGSDHFPITIHKNTPARPDYTLPLPKYKTDLANWERLNESCEKSAAYWICCLNQQVAQMTKVIRSAANWSIPQTKRVIHKAKVLWWNVNLQQLRDQKQCLISSYKANMNDTNLITYKKAVLSAKRNSLEKFTSKISPVSSTKKSCPILNA